MFVKVFDKTIYIEQLEALDCRLHKFHELKEIVIDHLKKELRGAKGQTALNFPLKFLPHENYFIFHNLRLPDENGYFEIDTLLLCKNYFLLIEVKNWYGTLYFDGENQVIRVGDDGIQNGLPNPIPQVKLQRHRFRKWLNKIGIPHIPMLYLVVISFPSTIIKPLFPDKPVPSEVIHSNLLPFKIQKINSQHSTSAVKMHELSQLSSALIAAHTPSEKDILKKFGIAKSDLIKGVFCPSCSAIPMLKQNRKWICPSCHHTSYDAHLPALNDYKLLNGDKITNREARDFLQIESPYATKRILQRENFKTIGDNGSRKYILEFDKSVKRR